MAQNANPLMKTINGFDTDNLTSILNSIYKQANEQNNSQRLQYEQLTKTLNDSIEAKNTAEQERVNRLNKCVDVIEKTFSAGTFERIIEHISNMTKSFNSIHENKYIQIDNTLNNVNNGLNNVYATIKELTDRINKYDDRIEALEEEPQDIEETVKSATSECLEEYNIIIDELNEKIAKQEETINQLVDRYNNVVKQHSDLINKLSLAVYNIDKNIYNQIFNDANEEQETEP